MDPYDGVVLTERFDPQWEPVRRSMGYTLAFANRLDLAKCIPNNRLASTEYCLADPGKEYLVYVPSAGKVTVDLSAEGGSLAVEWFDPSTGKTTKAEGMGPNQQRHLEVGRTAATDGCEVN